MSGAAKQAAAAKAFEHLKPLILKAERIGVGTGSTVGLVVEKLLADKETREALTSADVYASSLDTLLKLWNAGIKAYTFLPREPLDVYFDGADEVAFQAGTCMAVKGRGAAMTREKIMAYNSLYTILVVDESKASRSLGEKGKPVPVEVLPVALQPVLAMLEERGVRVAVRDECKCRDGPALTDNSGVVVDTWPWGRMTVFEYEALLDSTPGVIGHGLFIGYMDAIIVGYADGGSRLVECRRTRSRGRGQKSL